MLRLEALAKGGSGAGSSTAGTSASDGGGRGAEGGAGGGGRISIRDKLLVGEVAELEREAPSWVSLEFASPSELHRFRLTVRPESGTYRGGVFRFAVAVPAGYNNEPPVVRCESRVWHPNISEEGHVCLSLLRGTSVDGMGWAPTRRLKDVVLGLAALFGDLCDFDDPLNDQAAAHFHHSPQAFAAKAQDYIRKYASQ